MIFGDYDVDGLTSAAILFHALKRLNATHSVRLPNREKDGYGLSRKFMDEFIKLEIKLVITVDCGISCAEEIAYASQNNIDVIVTDHHAIPAKFPDKAFSINHPKQQDCNYPFKELTGAGVALKLAHALFIHNLGEDAAKREIEELIELSALGTIADLGIIQGENRLIVKKGLENLSKTAHPGLKILKDISQLSKEITTSSIGFQLAPRINAAGRIGDPYSALKLLIGSDENALYKYGNELNELNQKRQKMTMDAFETALEKFENLKSENKLPYILVAENPKWHVGILGLLASKLAEEFGRPAIIMQDLGETLVGSARSIEAFNIIEAISNSKELLMAFGGHKEAAGFTIKKENLKKFKKALTAYAEENLKDKDLRPTLNIDCEISENEITEKLTEEINQMKPFGIKNPKPLFLLKNIKPTFIETVGRNRDHIKFEAEKKGKTFKAIGFRLGEFAEEMRKHRSIDLACYVEMNEWNNSKNLQLEIVDFKKS
jgi:single-stranded-DNA-specific exonuclease